MKPRPFIVSFYVLHSAWTYLQLAEEQNVNITGRVVRYFSCRSFFGMEARATDETHSACKTEATETANEAQVQQI